jgi:hypothetical protein
MISQLTPLLASTIVERRATHAAHPRSSSGAARAPDRPTRLVSRRAGRRAGRQRIERPER